MNRFFLILVFSVYFFVSPAVSKILEPLIVQEPFKAGKIQENLFEVGGRAELLSGESSTAFFLPISLSYRHIELDFDTHLSVSTYFASKNNYGGDVQCLWDDHIFGLSGGAFFLPDFNQKVIFVHAKYGRPIDTREESVGALYGAIVGTQKSYVPFDDDQGLHHSFHMNYEFGGFGTLYWMPMESVLVRSELRLLGRSNAYVFGLTALSSLMIDYVLSPQVLQSLSLNSFMGDTAQVVLLGFVDHNSTTVVDDPVSLWTFGLGFKVQW